MTKRYLRFNKNKPQKSIDNDEMVLDIEKDVSKLNIESRGLGITSRMDSRSTSNVYGNKDLTNNPETQEEAEAFKNMKKIWKKAVFSIKKDTKPKAGSEYTKPFAEEPAPQREESRSTRNTDIDPIYLMLRKAAYKTSDGTEQPVEEEKRGPIESTKKDRDQTRRESATKIPSNEDMRKIQESYSATKLNSRRRIDQRMKSLSVDNPEIEIKCSNDEEDDSIYEQSKKFSSSFTNTSGIESSANCHPMRKKYMNDQHRSISMENESQPITTTGYDSHRSSSSIKSNELMSPRQSTRYINAVADEPRHNSQSSISKVNLRANRGNWKMKSFSVDIPDGDNEISSTSSQSAFKANSHTSSPIREKKVYYKTSESPGHDSRSSHSNLYGSKRPTRLPSVAPNASEVMINSAQARHHTSRNDSGYENISAENRRLSNNSYVVLFDFYARRSDELDLKAGWRVTVLNCSDPDWWTGKCNGRIGYFPSTYVQKIKHGDSVWKIVRDINLDDDDGNTFRLHKGEIAVQQGSQDGETIPICIKRVSYLWCPIDYVGKIFDDYI